jgi:hypothetical protein
VTAFKDSEELYSILGRFFQEVTLDEKLGPEFRRADTIVRYELTDPEARITVRLQDGKESQVDFGDSEMEPEVVMSMAADVAHRFWQGGVNVSVALARGQIKAKGPVAKILKLVPIAKPAFPRYVEELRELGREDLIEA